MIFKRFSKVFPTGAKTAIILLVTTVTRYPHPHRVLSAQPRVDSGSGWWLNLLWLALRWMVVVLKYRQSLNNHYGLVKNSAHLSCNSIPSFITSPVETLTILHFDNFPP